MENYTATGEVSHEITLLSHPVPHDIQYFWFIIYYVMQDVPKKLKGT